jgi:hypothetical protein
MTLREAADRLRNQRVTVTTMRAEVTGTLKVIGDDFFDVEHRATKSTLIPFAQVVSIKED